MFAFVLLRSSWWLRMDVLQLSQTHFVLHMKVPFCMFDVLRALGLAGGSSGWWNPWATNSWSKSWEIIHKKSAAEQSWGWTTREKTPISPGAGVTEPHNTQNKPLPEVSEDPEELVEFTEGTDSSASHAAMPGHAKKSILQRILRSLCSAARRLELMLCSGM